MVDLFRLKFVEYALSKNAIAPGWEIVFRLISEEISDSHFISGWIFRIDSKNNNFIKISEINIRKHFIDKFKENIFKDAIGIIKVKNNVVFHSLFENFVRGSEGIILSNQKSNVFPEYIESGDWFNIEKDEIAVVIYHDGDPLFLLQKAEF